MSDKYIEQISEALREYNRKNTIDRINATKKQREQRARNLKNIRSQRGYSQSKLAELSGVNLRMIQGYEQGVKDINIAQAITLYKLAQALECNMEDLLEGDFARN